MSGHDDHDRLLEAATAAALKVLDDAAMDDDAAKRCGDGCAAMYSFTSSIPETQP
jgi:hypothetical protein